MFTDNTMGFPPESEMAIKMNEWQEQRNSLLDAAIKTLARSPEPKGRWMEMLEEAYRVLKEAPDDIAMPALRIMAIQPLGMALEALRTAPRAKEE